MNIKIEDSNMKDIEMASGDMAIIVVALIDYANKYKSDVAKNILKKLNVDI